MDETMKRFVRPDNLPLPTSLAHNPIRSARLGVDAWGTDPDDDASLKQALTELKDAFNRVGQLSPFLSLARVSIDMLFSGNL